jgi:hypothetical protein
MKLGLDYMKSKVFDTRDWVWKLIVGGDDK